MGKPYQSELEQIPNTIQWALRQNVDRLRHTLLRELGTRNLIAVGSGGSLVAATFAALLHEAATGRLARASTPLEATTRPATQSTGALLLSARGSNADIQQAANILPQLGYEPVSAISTRKGSPLGPILEHYGGISHEFPIPSGRDGFLATNSLMATVVLLYRATMAPASHLHPHSLIATTPPAVEGPQTALGKTTLVVLAQGWAAPAALDFETRFSEAALANVTVTDPRNFAHGRHNWLSLHSKNTAIISLETPDSQREATRMIRYLPEGIDVLRVRSQQVGPPATIELLSATMTLAGQAAQLRGIDPGRPSVAEFGRRLYRAGSTRPAHPPESAPIAKKRAALYLTPGTDHTNLINALSDFVQRLEQTSFPSLAMDYDGTLCQRDRRFESPDQDIQTELNRLLHEGIRLGVASGRGGSMLEHLRHTISQKYWDRVTIGLYNGAKVIKLSDTLPDPEDEIPPPLDAAGHRLQSLKLVLGFEMSIRPHQISIRPTNGPEPYQLRAVAAEHLAHIDGISLKASSHSVDVVLAGTSKTTVVDALLLGRPGCVLRIGDQGATGGNDFDLLDTGLSLSVDRVSSNLQTCWHLGKPGQSGPRLTIQYLRALRGGPDGFRFDASSFLSTAKG